MRAPADFKLIDRWRIVEADLWDCGYLNLSGPAMVTIGGLLGRGDIPQSYTAHLKNVLPPDGALSDSPKVNL